MTAKVRRQVPIYSDGAIEYFVDLDVAADEIGESWLEPGQVRLLDQLRLQLVHILSDRAQGPDVGNHSPASAAPALKLSVAGKSWKVHSVALREGSL